VKIRDVMTPDIEVVIPEETLSTAAQLMVECDLDALPVSDNNRFCQHLRQVADTSRRGVRSCSL
jgi:CBS domain-containing protein